MKTLLSLTSFIAVFSLTLTASVNAEGLSCDPWVPYGTLKDIPIYEDCEVTKGDVAVAMTNGIYWCSEVAARLERETPGVTHFAYVHEYGHYIHGTDEAATDCWAAKELKNTCYIPIVISHLMKHGDEYRPGYGYMRDRANLIYNCSVK